ncbi:MAG: asparagine synthase C-terminal domain-containing protein [Candidatus Omnitrophota bacterium]|jgi:asparagine synthase (glutamine-hydrolysing)
MENFAAQVRETVSRAAAKISCDGVLFSGGLDSSIVAALNPGAVGITVSLERSATDLPYADVLAKTLGMRQIHRFVSTKEAIRHIPDVIRILKSFDPALPNDLAAYFGLETARKLELRRIGTGDASDELFGGYSFMADLGDLDGYIRRVSRRMVFSSNDIGEAMKLGIVQPFLDPSVIKMALKIPAALKIRRSGGKQWGKWVLRKAFEGILPAKIAWQSKRPLEVGSGMTHLRRILTDRISDKEFNSHSYPVKFFNKEHFYYYKIYRKVVGGIPRPAQNEKTCPGCGAGMPRTHFHCKVCGHVLPFLQRYLKTIKGTG